MLFLIGVICTGFPSSALLQLVRFQQHEVVFSCFVMLLKTTSPLASMNTQSVRKLISPRRADLHCWICSYLWPMQGVTAGLTASLVGQGRGTFWPGGAVADSLEVLKLPWNRTLKLWFWVCFQSTLLVEQVTLTPPMELFLAGLGPQSGLQPAGRSASMTE